MKALFGIGLALLVLGVVSLLVPIPRHEREGVSLGGVSIGVETRHKEKASPVVSATLLLGGVGLLVAGKRKG
jgi:hypothetical protein